MSWWKIVSVPYPAGDFRRLCSDLDGCLHETDISDTSPLLHHGFCPELAPLLMQGFSQGKKATSYACVADTSDITKQMRFWPQIDTYLRKTGNSLQIKKGGSKGALGQPS